MRIEAQRKSLFIKSYAVSRDNLINGTSNKEGVGNIHYGDIHATFSTPSIDLKKVSVPMVKDRGFTPKSGDYLIDGDLIMADVSEDYAGIGVTVSVHGLNGKKIVGGLHTFVLRDKKHKTDEYFRQYLFRNPKIRNSLQKVANGVSVYGISKSAVSKLPLPIPPFPEQKRIVAVLETWDRTVEKLTKKIEAKKAIKKGLRQKLLTGKTRLHGFKDKWKDIEVGKVFCFLKTYAISRENLINNTPNSQGVGNVHYGDIHSTYGSSSIDLKNTSIPSIKDVNFTPNAKDLLINGDLIMADVSEDYEGVGITISIHGLENKKAVGGLHTFVLRDNSRRTDERYRQYIFQNQYVRNRLRKIANGVSVYSISKNNLLKFPLCLPSVPEQAAIAKVLIATDKEIERLEQKLSLLTNQKKYLLNNLITGAIRTPETLSVNSKNI